MWSLKLIPSKTKIDFVKFRYPALLVSCVLLIASFVSVHMRGINFGIDFAGGTLIELGVEDGEIDIAALRARLNGLALGDVQIQKFGTPQDVLVRVAEKPDAQDTSNDLTVVSVIKQELQGEFTFRRVEIVGPQVSTELIRAGMIAFFVALASMLVYIWFRFEWQFSLGAVAALVHDVLLTIGLFSVFQLEFNLSILAALLTIVGYSMNDTVVVYDRVRENLRKYKRMILGDLLNVAVNETLSRTIMTSLTTLLALLALYILGGEVIRGFTLAMIWGVLIGTYSSIFVASPLLLWLGVKRDWSKVQAS